MAPFRRPHEPAVGAGVDRQRREPIPVVGPDASAVVVQLSKEFLCELLQIGRVDVRQQVAGASEVERRAQFTQTGAEFVDQRGGREE
jgi:phosphoribosylamine-glycine ligase